MGVGEPCAVHHNGRFFQLADVLGVDKELGYTLSTDKYDTKQAQGHFITEDMEVNPADGHEGLPPIDFGESMKNVYALGGDTEIVEYSDHEVHLSVHGYGKGRGVYIAGLPYSYMNTRILLRSMYYAAARERDMKKWYADNIYCEVHAYPETGKYAVVNNSSRPQVSMVYDGQGNGTGVELKPCEIRWFSM